VPEVAEVLGVSVSTVYTLVASGQLPSFKLGEKSTRVGADVLAAWIESRKVPHAMPSRRPRVLEKDIQAAIVRLLRTLGFEVWTTGTTRRRGDYQGTCMTPGLPDVFAFGRGRLLCVEVKKRGAPLRPGQAAFREACQGAGVAHVVGDTDAVVDWLVKTGAVQPWLARRRDAFVDQVPEEGEAD